MAEKKIEDCSGSHCSIKHQQVNNTCKQLGWELGKEVLVCNDAGDYCCLCYCSCFAHGTLVAVSSNKFSAIEEIKVKDKILAAGADLSWKEVRVMFSSGTKKDSISIMLEVTYREGEEIKTLLCTEEQPFLMPSKLLKRADKLEAGNHLVLFDGEVVEVIKLKHISVRSGIHHIATGIVKPDSMDGHLLNIQGIVAADYLVQLYQDELPNFFETSMTRAFSTKKAPIEREEVEDVFLQDYVASNKQDGQHFWTNTLLKESIKTSDLGGVSFVTAKQALQIEEEVPKCQYSDINRISKIEYLFTIFKAFYPDVNFLSDWANEGGNAYVTALGKDEYYFILQGGLARCEPISFEGLAIIISTALGRIYGGKPQRPDGFSCNTQADFYGTGIVMRKAWYLELYRQMVFPGISQIKALFSYLEDDTSEKVEGCVTPTLDCRIETLVAGATLQYLPKCAGGKGSSYLEVHEAKSKQQDEVTIYFNEKLDIETANNIKNYTFSPVVEVLSAEVEESDYKSVRILAVFESDLEYQVVVTNVIAQNGDSLDPELNEAIFTAF